MKLVYVLLVCFLLGNLSCATHKPGTRAKPVVVWQPSHQTDTGTNFSEAAVCNGIAEAAMAAGPKLNEVKVWSLNVGGLHHGDRGSNTMVAHTSAVVDGKISGYAYELETSNKLQPTVFISIHNNGGTNRHAVWGFIHAGDAYEKENRELASRLIAAISQATHLENRGVHLDSTTGRNDYRCVKTGARAFYSLDENVNQAPYRVLLEIGDNKVSYDFLNDAKNQRVMGIAIKEALAVWMREKNIIPPGQSVN